MRDGDSAPLACPRDSLLIRIRASPSGVPSIRPSQNAVQRSG